MREPKKQEKPKKRVIPSDVLGSYTGDPEGGLYPVQDADDL